MNSYEKSKVSVLFPLLSQYLSFLFIPLQARRIMRGQQASTRLRTYTFWGQGSSSSSAFTLAELLTVIAVVALLMAILLPSLQRARHQAKAVVCQSNLRQWGLIFPMYLEDNDGRFFPFYESVWCEWMQPYYYGSEDLLFCPMATKLNRKRPVGHPWADDDFVCSWIGGKFSAWGILPIPDIPFWPQRHHYGSYGLNTSVCDLEEYRPWDGKPTQQYERRFWGTCFVKGTDNVPVLMDCSDAVAHPESNDPPPKYDDQPMREDELSSMHDVCINRHDGFVNALFMDWSVRKVGLKELWTLKWEPEFNTAGPWTRAGGVRPQDWPKWMRRFKDY
jgi:prepilin-type processing-associated H-X9-DG protein